jgi:hypothetical protein
LATTNDDAKVCVNREKEGHMSYKTAFFVLLVWILAIAAAVSASPIVEEFVVCQDIDEGGDSFTAIGITNTFTSSDDEIHCYLRVWLKKRGIVTFKWYAPDGSLYQTNRTSTLSDSYTWHIYRTLKVSGTEAASLYGQWTVKCTISPPVALTPVMGGFHPKEVTQTFTIKKHVTPSVPDLSPAVQLPLTTAPTATTKGEWQVGDYLLSVTSSIKSQYFHDIAHVTLVIGFPDRDKWILVQDVQVDTGAFESMLPMSVAEKLGVDVTNGTKVDFHSVTGDDVGWEHELTVGVVLLGGGGDADGYILGTEGKPYLFKVPIVFYNRDSDGTGSKLLGRKGVLSVLNLSFGEHVLTITLQSG